MEEEYYYKDTTEAAKEKKKPSKALYALPVLLGLIGGLIGYLLVKDEDRSMAKKMIIVGLLMSIVLPAIIVLSGATAFYSTFSPSSFMGPTATGFDQVQVSNLWRISAPDGAIEMNVVNMVGGMIEVNEIAYTIDGVSVSCNPGTTLDAGESSMISCMPRTGWVPREAGETYSAEVVISYRYPPEAEDLYPSAGTLTGTFY